MSGANTVITCLINDVLMLPPFATGDERGIETGGSTAQLGRAVVVVY